MYGFYFSMCGLFLLFIYLQNFGFAKIHFKRFSHTKLETRNSKHETETAKGTACISYKTEKNTKEHYNTSNITWVTFLTKEHYNTLNITWVTLLTC
jgi:hypothetical protein